MSGVITVITPQMLHKERVNITSELVTVSDTFMAHKMDK